MNKNYWNKYYKSKKTKLNPSNFARFIINFFKKKKLNNLLEIGCGDGRDSFYFSQKLKKIISIDRSKEAIKKNTLLLKKKKIKNLLFLSKDITKIKQLRFNDFDILYARFFLHTINLNDEDKLLTILKKRLKVNTYICLEFRTIKDEMFNKGKKLSTHERITDHYRRFINVKNFRNKVKKDFKILYCVAKKGFSKYKKENPHLCRIIFKKI